MQRLKTRAQFEAAMAGGTVSRTPHFVLHRAAFPGAPSPSPDVLPAQAGSQEGAAAPVSRALFGVRDEPWIGAVLPKRHAKRAVTRNGIKRQIYNVSAAFEPRLSAAVHVVRLRQEFARKDYPSAWSEPLKAAVRGELQQLFNKAAGDKAVLSAPPSVIPAQAGTQESAAALDGRPRGNDGALA